MSSVPTSFKDLIERRAAEHGILFVPLVNKFHEGKQTYQFGSVQIYVDRNVVFMLDCGKWIPVSLNMLMDRCR